MAPPLPLNAHNNRPLWVRSLFFGLVLAVLTVQAGCGNPQERQNEELREEIIDIHDRAMDKIGLMFALEMRLRNEPPAGVPAQVIERRIQALKEANRAMFRWMNQYQTLGVEGDMAADNRYRIEQLEQIKEVSRLTDRAIAEANQILSGD